ncbi:glycosyltransferase [Methanobrevibacter sp.]|uniref:glycosyltransferase n=1 Tax=Methanobrevibacter sp. TaxID=66852 RepID=UPI00388F5608
MIKESELNDGISAIIPTYKGENFISRLLDSLINQTIDFNLFEAIFIVNGELDSTTEIIKKYQKDFPNANIILTRSEKGVCNARNKGIELASKKYCIFIDDDDYISYNYFEELYKHVKPNRIVLGTFYDLDDKTKEVKNSYMTPQLLENSGTIENPYNTIKEAIVITTNKIIPTINVKNSKFNSELTNGVDIAYYANFYPENDFEFYVVDKNINAKYFRLWRHGSISRQDLSYKFNVDDRLKVINEINKGLNKARTQEMRSFIESLSGGQIVLINEYLKKHPEDYSKVLDDILAYNFEFFPYKYLNEDITKLNNDNRELIISYAFSPTNTTTSNVVAKRILSEKKNVDVICGSLDNIQKDFTLEKVVLEYIVNKFTVKTNFSTDWNEIKNFTKKGLELLGNYEKIYSRAFFAHSHFLALEYKLKHPETYWRAEFSDPLVKPLGRRTSNEINDKEYVERINSHLKNKNLELIDINDDVNLICEYLTFIYADEIIFTNENQKKVMINSLKFDISNIINEKAVLSPHPTLDEKYYKIIESKYNIDDEYLNFAYFGNIFSKRSFEDFISAFENINNNIKYKIHIFSKNKTLFEQILPKNIYKNCILNSEVNFLEFLNLTNKFDILLVEDSYTLNDCKINPYLPSKISDYMGCETEIWAVCEKNSPMDKIDIKYKSQCANYSSNINTINQIIKDKLNINSENELIKENIYHRQRNNHLTQKISELIEVCETEFKKDKHYESQINELTQKIQILEKENSEILNSNSWKMTKNLRKIGKKFK